MGRLRTTRRQALLDLARGAGLLLLAACQPRRQDGDSGDSAPPASCPEAPGCEAEGWVAVDLAAYPELFEVGGQAAVDVDEALLHVLVVRTSEDSVVAVWRVCTHGACEVGWEGGSVFCPCHGSRFDTDGAVLEGPATVPLRAFEAEVVGDTLWILRPL